MARYTHALTTSIVNKLGGVVFTTAGPHRTLRARPAPANSSSPVARAVTATTANAVSFYQAMTSYELFGYQLASSWWAYFDGPHSGKRCNPLAYIAACFQNAQVLGTTPSLGVGGYDVVCPPVLGVAASLSAGVYSLGITGPAGAPYTNPFLVYVSIVPAHSQATPLAGAGTLLGGCDGSPSFALAVPMIVKLGFPPTSGMTLYVRIKPLIPGFYFWGQSNSSGAWARLPQFATLLTLP